MTLTVKCLPTSRRKSVSGIGHSQSALSISRAEASPGPKSRNASSCLRIPAALASISSLESTGRSASLPLGSPTRVVPPPSTAMGR
jgi:hypothetical protein